MIQHTSDNNNNSSNNNIANMLFNLLSNHIFSSVLKYNLIEMQDVFSRSAPINQEGW